MYIDERLEFRMRSSLGFEDDDDDDDEHDRGGGSSVAVARVTPLRQVMSHKLFSRIEHLQHLLDTFLACRPTGFLFISILGYHFISFALLFPLIYLLV
ncbi:Putative clathrin assembly protein At1g03050 [Linum perenne]